MKIKKPKGGRRSLALGELAAEVSEEHAHSTTPADSEQEQLAAPEAKKSKLRRSLGGKVEKSRRSSRINKWSILDMFGFGSKKNKSSKSHQVDASSDKADPSKPMPASDTSGENAASTSKPIRASDTSSGEDLNESSAAAFEAGHTPMKRDQIKPIDTKNRMDRDILQENTTIHRKKGRLSLDMIGTPGLFKKGDRKPLNSLTNDSQSGTSGIPKRTGKVHTPRGPEITVSMITTTKQRLKSTSETGNTDSEDVDLDRKPRSKVTRETRYVQKPSGIPVRCVNKPRPDVNARKPPPAKRKTEYSAQSTGGATVSRSDRARTTLNNIRHAGSTPPRVSRRESMTSRREGNISRRESTRKERLNFTGDTGQQHGERTPRCKVTPLAEKQSASKTFEPAISLKYFDEDVTEAEIQDGGIKDHVISLSAEDLAALDLATNLHVPGTDSKTSVQKRESLIEAMKKSPLLSPECHQTPTTAPEEAQDTPVFHNKSGRKSVMSSVSSTLSRSFQSSKSNLRGLRMRKAKTPQGAEMVSTTPRTHLRALKRAHSIAVTSNIASLRCPGSPLLTPLSSVAKELEEMKPKKRRKEPTLEEILKEHRKNKKDESTVKKAPPKPPRKNLKSNRSVSRGRLRRRSIVGEDPGDPGSAAGGGEVSVKRKPSIKEMLKRKPPAKPARRSSGSRQDDGTRSEQEASCASGERSVVGGHTRASSLGESVRKLRRKLSRSSDMRQDRGGHSPRSQAQVMSANAGHTPKPPRGRKDERLV